MAPAPSGALVPRQLLLGQRSSSSLAYQFGRFGFEEPQVEVEQLDTSRFPFWHLPLTDVRKVGEGSSGVVLRAAVEGTDDHVAIKTIQLRSPIHQEEAEMEAALLDRFGGGHVVSLLDAIVMKGEGNGNPLMMLYMEAAAGNMWELAVENAATVPTSTKLRLLVQVLRGVRELELGGYVHRDIKPANVLIFGDRGAPETWHAKLGDLGVAMDLEHVGPKGITGTPSYIAPEVWSGQGHGWKSDVWSAGILAYALFVGRVPEALLCPSHQRRLVSGARMDLRFHPFRRFVPSGDFDLSRDTGLQKLERADPEAARLVRALLTKAAWRRPSVRRALARAEALARSRGADVPELPAAGSPLTPELQAAAAQDVA